MAVTKRVLKRLYGTKATRTHKAYQKYAKQEAAKKRKPLSFKAWSGSKEPVYFKGIKRTTPETRLKRAGLTTRTKHIGRGLKRAGVTKKKVRKLRD